MGTCMERRLLACENENLRLRKRLTRQNYVWIIAMAFIATGAVASSGFKDAAFGSIRANEVVVVDSQGVVRARLGGDLPDAVMAQGRVAKRGSKAAGLLIYDEEGIERGGYVTQDNGSNAMLTLDSKHKQAALLVAGPDAEQASALRLWTRDSAIELRSDSIGSRLSVNDTHHVVYQLPAIATLPAETCSLMKELEVEHPRANVCRSRFTDQACTACLEGD